jgi:hypothetical protein
MSVGVSYKYHINITQASPKYNPCITHTSLHIYTFSHLLDSYLLDTFSHQLHSLEQAWFVNSGSQTFDEDWWTMLIESDIEWTLNQSYEFKVFNSLSTLIPKTKDEHCWCFVPWINIKEDEDTYAFNRILVQLYAKFKWEPRRMGWCWFPSLNVYEMTPVFFP